jgi:Phosphotransferase System HPr (HPr) Family
MKVFQFTITDPDGIHARPAGLLLKKVKACTSKATLRFGEKSADLTKLFAVMGLAVKQGNTVSVTVEGPNEEKDAADLEDFFKSNL